MMPLRSFGWLVLAIFATTPRLAHADGRANACADAAERGQELRETHRLVEARPEFVACAQRECPNVIRESCTEWLTELERRTPSIVIAAKDAQHNDVPGLQISMDGAPLPITVKTLALPVNPGSHVLRYVASGYDVVEDAVTLREGEPVRLLTVTMRKSNLVESRERRFPVLPVVLGATSVIALSIFGYSAIRGASDYRRLERECSPRCEASEMDSVRSTFLVADIALLAGLVTGGAALSLWLFHRPSHTPPSSAILHLPAESR